MIGNCVAISYSTRDSALVSTDDLFGAPGKPDAAADAVQVWFTYARYKVQVCLRYYSLPSHMGVVRRGGCKKLIVSVEMRKIAVLSVGYQ